jgi:8-oxo-dGTP diphosphatase
MTSSNTSTDDQGMAFPTVNWPQWKCHASFFPGTSLPDVPKSSLYAVLGFIFKEDKVVLANIKGRGYCIPSGRIEEGEEALVALVREAYEETGAMLDVYHVQLIGWYSLVNTPSNTNARICPVYIARAGEFLPIPPESESLGYRFTSLEDVPALYFAWDDLLAAVFNYANQKRLKIE